MAPRTRLLLCLLSAAWAFTSPRAPRAALPRRSRPAARAIPAAVLPAATPAIKVTVGAVAQLAVNTALGASAVLTGLVDQATIKALARVVYAVFTPAFLFVAVIRTVSTYGFSRALLAMPFAAVAQIFVALALARGVTLPALGVDARSEEGRELALLSTFGNPGIFPLLLWNEVFRPSTYAGDPTVLPRLTALMAFYLMGTSPLLWSLGKAIVTGGGDADDDDEACLVGSPDECVGETRAARAWKAARAFVKPPPVAGVLAGLLAVSVPPLRALLVGPRAPLASVVVAAEQLSKAYLPSASLVLAGSFVGEARFGGGGGGGGDAAAAKPPAPGLKRRLLAVALVRFALLPATGLATLGALRALGCFPAPRAAPVLWFFFATQFVMPPAQNSVVIMQVAGSAAGATRTARALFILYMASALPISVQFSRFLGVCGL